MPQSLCEEGLLPLQAKIQRGLDIFGIITIKYERIYVKS